VPPGILAQIRRNAFRAVRRFSKEFVVRAEKGRYYFLLEVGQTRLRPLARMGIPKMSRVLTIFAALAASVVVNSGSAYAQISTKPISDVGGNAGTELRRIYSQGIGTGYTGESLNAHALRSAQAQIPNVGQSTATPRNLLSGGPTAGPARSSKPFSSISSSPTVSPYMNLFREDLEGFGDFNYQTLVRPQLNQLQLNQQFQNQNTELNQRVQSISAQRDYSNPAGSENLYPTGHSTAFGYHGRYYPALNAQRRGR
jgi:hypothetical protein